MAETVASQTGFRPAWACGYSPTPELRREQVEDFAELVETMLEKFERQEKELREVKRERDALKDELERRKGE